MAVFPIKLAVMTKRDKKLTVLHQLSLESEPISLPELLKKIPEYSERSVRRWLNELEWEGLVEKTGKKKATQYQARSGNGNQENHAVSSCFSSISAKVIEQVNKPIYEKEPTSYHFEWFDSYQPNVSFYFPTSIRKHLLNAGQRGESKEPAGTYAHHIFNRLLIDLSYNSSRLEGNTYSLLDTERLLLQGTSAEGKLDEEKVMILNHKEAIRYLVDQAPQLNVNFQTICTLHYLLSDGLLDPTYTGKVRDHAVKIGGSIYLPLEQAKQIQNQLEKIAKKASFIEDPFEQSLFLLVHISYLQAFADVNKRTARLASNIPLITKNLVPLSFNDVERADYTSAMIAVYELQDIRPLLDLYVFSYLRTCATYTATIKAMGFDQVRVLYRQQRRTFIRNIVLNQLIGEKLEAYIQSNSKIIPEPDRVAFVEDLREDLALLDQSRLAGLGVTTDELTAWINLTLRL
jgi:Fic family protein